MNSLSSFLSVVMFYMYDFQSYFIIILMTINISLIYEHFKMNALPNDLQSNLSFVI